MTDRLVADLRAVLGDDGILLGRDMTGHVRDWRDLFGSVPRAVLRPESPGEVAAIIGLCSEAGVAIVTQGGNTGMSGGAVGHDASSVILSTSRMRSIIDVNAEANTLTAEAGCTIQAIQEAARAVDRTFAPDWGARGTATIGGAVATNAGGINVLRYGTMRENVLGLEAVLADGATLDVLRSLRKDSSGYDLTQLFIGSEGTLGIVTKVVVTLHPPVRHEHSAIAALPTLDALMPLLALAASAGSGALCAFELIPEVGLARVCDTFDSTTRPIGGSDWYALIKLGSAQPVMDDLASLLEAATDEGLISDATVAATPTQEANLWMIRDQLPPTGLYPWHKVGIKGDTAVPIDRVGEYHDRVRSLVAEMAPAAICYGFGHVGDGNLHMMVLPSDPDGIESFEQIRSELIEQLDELAVAMGGTISAEHGVGQALVRRIRAQKSPVERELMHRIRTAFDPTGTLNPQIEF